MQQTQSTRPVVLAILAAASATTAVVGGASLRQWAGWGGGRSGGFVVVGRSMLPDLRPGDVIPAAGSVEPARLSRTRPERFQRWVVELPEGTTVVKRVAGLGGERIEIRGGDLLVDGRRLLSPPALLAETAVAVSGGSWQRRITPGSDSLEYRHLLVDPSRPVNDPLRIVPGPIHDSMPDDPAEGRRLSVVADFGLAAVLRPEAARRFTAAGHAASLIVRLGRQGVRWPLPSGGRWAFLAGRLDGRIVGLAWQPTTDHFDRRGLFPTGMPDRWDVVAEVPPPSDPRQPVRLSIGIDCGDVDSTEIAGGGVPPMAQRSSDAAVVARDAVVGDVFDAVVIWRGQHLRPAANAGSWDVGSNQVFLLGDHPSASRDSRHFGPVDEVHLRHRLP